MHNTEPVHVAPSLCSQSFSFGASPFLSSTEHFNADRPDLSPPLLALQRPVAPNHAGYTIPFQFRSFPPAPCGSFSAAQFPTRPLPDIPLQSYPIRPHFISADQSIPQYSRRYTFICFPSPLNHSSPAGQILSTPDPINRQRSFAAISDRFGVVHSSTRLSLALLSGHSSTVQYIS